VLDSGQNAWQYTFMSNYISNIICVDEIEMKCEQRGCRLIQVAPSSQQSERNYSSTYLLVRVAFNSQVAISTTKMSLNVKEPSCRL